MNCGEKGHFKSVCSRPRKKLGQLRLQSNILSSVDTVNLRTMLHLQTKSLPHQELAWLPDTGSDIDAIRPSDLALLGAERQDLTPDVKFVTSAVGERLNSLGTIAATIFAEPYSHQTDLHVYEGLSCPLLSRQTLKALHFLPHAWPQESYAGETLSHRTVDVVRETPANEVDPGNEDPAFGRILRRI